MVCALVLSFSFTVISSLAADGEQLVEVLAECQATYDEEMGFFALDSITLVSGETYQINYNGTEYECVAQTLEGLGIAIGNLSDYGGMGSGEPFAIALEAEGWILLPFDGSTSVTLSIYQVVSSSDSSDSTDTVTDPYITSFSFAWFDVGDSATNYNSFLVGLVSGQTYEVIYNGTSYICEAKTGYYSGVPYVYVGNPKWAFSGVFAADGDLPFGYVEINTGNPMSFVGASQGSSGTVYDFSFYHYVVAPDEVLRNDITSFVDSSTGWVSSFVGAVVDNPLILCFVVLAFVGVGVGIVERLKK